jgi:anti-anti-sigma factor
MVWGNKPSVKSRRCDKLCVEREIVKVESRSVGDVGILKILGTVDLYEGYLLRDEVRRLLRAGARSLLYECTGIDYVDSTGLGIFLHTRDMAREAGGRVGLVDPSPAFRKVLSTTQVDRLIPVFDTIEDALNGIRG